MLAKERVAVIKAREDLSEAIRKSIEFVGGLEIHNGDNVVVKPNICNPKNPFGMVLTDFRIIEAILILVKEKTEKIKVVESDNVSGNAEKRADESGLLELLDRVGVEFMNLSVDEYDVYDVSGKQLKLPQTILKADYLINLPKMKTCGHTGVTLSIKNLFGILQKAKKNKLHKYLDEILPFLAKVIRNDMILVDGLTAMEGNGPVIGTPLELGIVIAGTNPVSVDSVCANIMGFNPSKITHIARAAEIVQGTIDIERINILGDGWERFRSKFERPYTLKASLKSLRSIRKVYLT